MPRRCLIIARFVAAIVFACAVLIGFAAPRASAQTAAVQWWKNYRGAEANGAHVLGYWKFDGDNFTRDSSSHTHTTTLRGAKQNPQGRFGACLESSAGYPVIDESHGFHVKASPVISPRGAFTVEMWIKPKAEKEFPAKSAPVLMDMKYVPYNHTGFMWTLTKAAGDGKRQLGVQIGMGTRTEHWYSDAVVFLPTKWYHVAFTYNASGTVAFYVDGSEIRRVTKPNAGPMALAKRPLSIGDRIGSNYNGFPGFIDEVRMTRGVREFRPIKFEADVSRFVTLRMSKGARITGVLINQSGGPLKGATLNATLPGGNSRRMALPQISADGQHDVDLPFDASLKPGKYEARLSVELPQWGAGDAGYRATTRIPVVILPRPLPHRMPVVMWGVGGTDGLVKEIPRLKAMGFTHALGLRVNYQQVWDDGAKAMPSAPDEIRKGREMLNVALENDIRVVASLSPGSWLRRAKVGEPYRRIDRQGNHYGREDVSGLFEPIQRFCYNTGAAMGKAYGHHPAFAAALLHTEVRGESQVSFHPEEIEAYRKATGRDIPAEVTIKNGVQYQKLKNFPGNRVIADDDPILQYLSWFWKKGDGWNDLNTRLHAGLKQHVGHDDFWTFYDPACRVPSIGGSGGNVDVLSHWTYSYPDPIRIGLCTDELFEMSRVGGRNQDVMKMTQLIWYRSQTAPIKATAVGKQSPWVDRDPQAAYITVAPMHLREAFWWKLARPIKGIMYHGWQSLVETETPYAYRYTNPSTQKELAQLTKNVVVPLGPALMQVPDADADVAFLESFTSQMFARRGTYGWNHTWAGDMYHILMYAQLQPRVLYEESLLNGGLQGAKVLVAADCDVLTESAVKAIKQFQANGGLVVGDAELCPAIKPDLVIPRMSRAKQADLSKQQLQTAATKLRAWLDDKYARHVDSSNSEVVTRRRRFGTTDYVFAVNDHREYGDYVGGYRLVMEDGLPSETFLRLRRSKGSVYDLLQHRELSPKRIGDELQLPLQLGPCAGRILMVTEKPIQNVEINAPKMATRGQRVEVKIEVTDGESLVDAVIPIEVRISDPEGVAAEFSGYYGAASGYLTIPIQFASNDRTGVWEIRAKELASGKSAAGYVRLKSDSR